MTGIMNPIHIAFIAMVALIFLGPKRLPELAKTLGSGLKEFRETISLDHNPDHPEAYSPEAHAPVTAALATPLAPVPPLAPSVATHTAAPVPPLAPPVAMRSVAPVAPLAPGVSVLHPRAETAPPQPPAAA
jgi:sec-independent protein translocase protein TatA